MASFGGEGSGEISAEQAADLSNISLGQSSDPGSPTPGSADMESQAAFEAGYEEKRMRLEELTAEVRNMRADLARKDEDIRRLREELGLTPMAQLMSAVGNSVAVQKTKEIGGRVKESEAYKKTQSTLSEVGTKTGELLKSAGAKTQQAFTSTTSPSENGESKGWGDRFRQASVRIKERVSRSSTSDEQSTVDADDIPT